MGINHRRLLVELFLAIPQTKEEMRWLVEKARDNVQKALEYLYELDASMASSGVYGICNPEYDDSDSYEAYQEPNEELQKWLLIEEELYSSIGYEDCYCPEMIKKISHRIESRNRRTRESLYLQTVVSNLCRLVAEGDVLLMAAAKEVAECKKEYHEQKESEAEDSISKQFHLEEALGSAQDRLHNLTATFPYGWLSLREIAGVQRAMDCISDELVSYITADDRLGFTLRFLEEQAEKRAVEYFAPGFEEPLCTRPLIRDDEELWIRDEDVPF